MKINIAEFFRQDNIAKIDAAFLEYIADVDPSIQINDFREKNKPNPHTLIALAVHTETFIYKIFGTKVVPDYIGKFAKILEVRRNFVARTAVLKYKIIDESWQYLYQFTSEENFANEVLELQRKQDSINLEKYEKYAAWAVTQGKYEIFRLPKKNALKDNFFHKSGDEISGNIVCLRNNFNLTDILESDIRIASEVSYCIYCHKRGNDSCKKGNGIHSGCPVKQDISEMHSLIFKGNPLAALIIAMAENPFLIITGKRICNDCELACIFQNQEAVRTQDVETDLLNRIFHQPMGLEIYYLLMLWNPLRHENFMIKSASVNKNSLVVGAGPAGIALSYYLLMNGAKVHLIDSLDVKPSKIADYISKNCITDITPILNNSLENRTPTCFGGVMEYGITVRWNKNYIDILMGLMMRFEHINIVGNILFGSGYTLVESTQDFNSVSLCTGAGRPKLPKHLNLFNGNKLNNGIITASDFLMSLHLKKSDIKITSPVLIIGGGLTAMDAATESKALTGGNVTIIYHNSIQKSRSYIENTREIESTLKDGVKILENTEIIDILYDASGVCGVKTSTGKIIDAKTIIIAIGTNIHLDPIKTAETMDDKFTHISTQFTLFGDANTQYQGTVVKAIASAKDGYKIALNSMSNNVTDPNLQPFTKIESIKPITQNIFQIKIKSHIARKFQIGQIAKINTGMENIPLTVSFVENDILTFYVQNLGKSTDSLLKSTNVSITGPNGIGLNTINTLNKVFIVNQLTSLIFQNVPKKASHIFGSGSIPVADEYFIALSGENIEELMQYLKSTGAMVHIFHYNNMHCMMKGVCSRCINPDGTYSCNEQIKES